MTRLIFCYRGDGPPPGEDLAAIEEAVAKKVDRRDSALIELDIEPDRARELERKLPDWELFPVRYYGVPELESLLVPTTPKPPQAELTPEDLSELADKIRFYVEGKDGSVSLAKVLSAFTNQGFKWQHVMAALRQSHALHEDGRTIWIDPA